MFRHILKVLKSIKEIYPATRLKIIGVSGLSQHKNIQIIYQIGGKATIVMEKPHVLIQELIYLKGFLKQDADYMFNLATTEKLAYAFKILSIHFEDETTRFEIEDVHTNYTLLLTASEMVNSNKMLENFSPNDITMIYFQLVKEIEQQQSAIKNQFSHQCRVSAKENIYVLRSIGSEF
jgi:hypothetical protein